LFCHTEEEVEGLLKKAGFKNIETHFMKGKKTITSEKYDLETYFIIGVKK